MTRVDVGAGLLLWAGAALLLAAWPRVSRLSLAERLRPYHAGRAGILLPAEPGLVPSAASLWELVGPLARAVGDKLAGLFGVDEPAGARLRRIHSPVSVTAFRTRQLGLAGASLGIGLVAAAAGVPLAADLLVLAGAPLLVFLVLEQRLANASADWQRTVGRELPVVAEQLALLLNAGYSLGAAVNRLADRGNGCCAADLSRVANRIRQGVDETRALKEWAEMARVESVDRLVAVLAMNAEASDLGRLVSAEARQARRDAQRALTEVMERRAQQVWVPVTVATLVPGVILLAVPFLAALRVFSNA